MNIFKKQNFFLFFSPSKKGLNLWGKKFQNCFLRGLMKKPLNIIGIQYSNLSLKIPPPYIHKSNGEIGLPSCLFTNFFFTNVNK